MQIPAFTLLSLSGTPEPNLGMFMFLLYVGLLLAGTVFTLRQILEVLEEMRDTQLDLFDAVNAISDTLDAMEENAQPADKEEE